MLSLLTAFNLVLSKVDLTTTENIAHSMKPNREIKAVDNVAYSTHLQILQSKGLTTAENIAYSMKPNREIRTADNVAYSMHTPTNSPE